MSAIRSTTYGLNAWRLFCRNGRLGTFPTPTVCNQVRNFSERANYIHVEHDTNIPALAILKFDRKPVNGLSKDFLIELDMTIEKLENNPQCRGVILTSAFPKIFSAGIDITEMYQKSPDYTNAFWRSLQNMWLRLYGSSLVTMAAINGHSPAGGCLIAISCDYRIMASGKYTIGLNETLLGIVAPFWFKDAMKRTIGFRETEKALQTGRLYNPDEALKVGLVDALADESQVVEVAKSHMVNWLKIPDHARELTKQMMRKKAVDQLRSRQEEDIAFFTTFIQKDSIQKSLGMYLASLKKK